MREDSNRFNSFAEFYPFYLGEHQNTTCRRLHVIGSLLVLIVLSYAVFYQHWKLLWLLPIIGYGFAWLGHFFFEKNRPATFKYPLYSLLGDWVMFWHVIIGKIRF
ncbi:MAG: Mpo1-like protein [Marinicella sp.]|nr:DUF962 domain-containing protein [Xanthomonadales bacterium]